MENVKSGFALFVTAALLIAGAWLLVLLIGRVSATQSEWDRYIYLLTGVEAVVFAAVGWLFGKEVHREQAQNATAQAKTANDQAKTAQASAASEKQKGMDLANAILSFHTTEPQRREAFLRLGLAEAEVKRGLGVTAPGMAQLVEQAKRAYPDLQ